MTVSHEQDICSPGVGRLFVVCLTVLIILFGMLLGIFPGNHLKGNLHAANLSEYDIKAAFVYNFCLFTEWPADTCPAPDTPIYLLVVGNDDLRDSFLKINGKKAGKRTLDVTFFNPREDILYNPREDTLFNPHENTVDEKALRRFHMVFFSEDVDAKFLTEMIMVIGDYPVLTLGETRDFIQKGGMVNFFEKNMRLLFEVHNNRVMTSHIRLSSRLLKLAIIVTD
ncbi:YfiR family protein [Desulfamplus magnetovallimortis]|uniref:YfiR family protein n=1 Tax=Desulfamplus magnetovallimortis TaxID=1246637 RepID=UPI0009BBFAAF|nr:YfiR family protein [Desulfamplus magnetovallimortis]